MTASLIAMAEWLAEAERRGQELPCVRIAGFGLDEHPAGRFGRLDQTPDVLFVDPAHADFRHFIDRRLGVCGLR